MGYTHYWHWTTAIADADKFASWSRDVQLLLEYLTTPEREFTGDMLFFGKRLQESEGPAICGPDGTGSPIITSEIVAFNGNASQREDHETFDISLMDLQEPLELGFCKTALNPYDILVICALVRLAHYFPDAKLWSDGEQNAINLGLGVCRDVFGENNQPTLG